MFRAMGPSASELRTIPLFHGFADDELAEIAGLFKHVDAGQASRCSTSDEPATTLYLLTKGEVVLERPGDDMFKLRPPALIGELGALTGLPRSTRATVTPGSTRVGAAREANPGRSSASTRSSASGSS